MRPGVFRVDGTGADAARGRVVFAPAKAAWNLSMLAGAGGSSTYFDDFLTLPAYELLD